MRRRRARSWVLAGVIAAGVQALLLLVMIASVGNGSAPREPRAVLVALFRPGAVLVRDQTATRAAPRHPPPSRQARAQPPTKTQVTGAPSPPASVQSAASSSAGQDPRAPSDDQGRADLSAVLEQFNRCAALDEANGSLAQREACRASRQRWAAAAPAAELRPHNAAMAASLARSAAENERFRKVMEGSMETPQCIKGECLGWNTGPH